MLRDILFSRAILVGIVCFVLIVGGTQFYRWQVLRGGAVRVLPTGGSLQQHSETERDPQQARGVLTETLPLSQKPETPVAEPRQMSDATAGVSKETEMLDLTDAFFPGEATEAEAPPEAVPVSPFGFGPYPPLPESWHPHTFPAPSAEHELMKRVAIKLLSQGVDVKGGTMKKGLVFPIIKGTLYVHWKTYWGPFGPVRYIGRATGHPEDMDRLHAIEEAKGRHESLTESDFPSDLKLVPYEEGGIDPYTFLELPNRGDLQ